MHTFDLSEIGPSYRLLQLSNIIVNNIDELFRLKMLNSMFRPEMRHGICEALSSSKCDPLGPAMQSFRSLQRFANTLRCKVRPDLRSGIQARMATGIHHMEWGAKAHRNIDIP